VALGALHCRGDSANDVEFDFAARQADARKNFREVVTPFVDNYCTRCHGQNRQRGGINFGPSLKKPGETASNKRWKQAVAAVKSHDMPPNDQKQPTEEERRKFLEGIAQAMGVTWTPEIEAGYANGLIMTWDHVRALARAGMDVESHSRHHRVLQTLDEAGLREELTGSREDLEAQLGRPVRAIAYPVGRRLGSGSERIRAAIAAAGYKIGLSNASGVNRIWPGSLGGMLGFDRYDVRRLSLDRTMSDAMFLTQFALPRLAYYGRHAD